MIDIISISLRCYNYIIPLQFYMPLSIKCITRYSCIVMDLYNRSVVASVKDNWISSKPAINAVTKVLNYQKSAPEGLIQTGSH